MSTGFWFNYALALVVVALMLGGLYIIVRGLARGRLLVSADRRLVTVLESTMLAQHVSVHVVKVGAQYLLIGGGQGHVNSLAQLPPGEVEAWLEQQRSTAGASRSLLEALRLRKQ
jgi:flagellar biogenesis protein FliO